MKDKVPKRTKVRIEEGLGEQLVRRVSETKRKEKDEKDVLRGNIIGRETSR